MRIPGPPRRSGPTMAVTITLKTLQQQTFKIRMEPDETVRARPEPGSGSDGCRGWGGGGEAGILTREAGKTARRRAVPILPTGLTFPDTLMVPGSAPGGSGGALGSLSRRGSTPGAPARPRVQCQCLRGAREPRARILGRPALGWVLRVPSFVGFSSGHWWPNLGVVTRRCRVMTATTIIINGLEFQWSVFVLHQSLSVFMLSY